MSYIRCLSNPESLYAWSDGETTHLWHNVRKPLSSGERPGKDFPSCEILVPTKIFDKVCSLWDECEQPASFRGARAEEVYVYTKTGEKVPVLPLKKFFKDKRPREMLIKFSYKGRFFMMWNVTWEYVVRSAVRQLGWEKERRAETRRKRQLRSLREMKAALDRIRSDSIGTSDPETYKKRVLMHVHGALGKKA